MQLCENLVFEIKIGATGCTLYSSVIYYLFEQKNNFETNIYMYCETPNSSFTHLY